MKTPKPGQFVSIQNKVYRAVKRKDGCKGCILDDIYLCPNISDKRYHKTFNCAENGIIIVKA